MTGFMFCTYDHRIEHMVKIPTVFSITVCHMIYSDIHISVHKGTKTSVNKLYLWSIHKCWAIM